MSNKNKICLKTTKKARCSFVSYKQLFGLKEYSIEYYAFHVGKSLSKKKINMSDDLLLLIGKFSKGILLECKRGIHCKNPNPFMYHFDKYYQIFIKKFLCRKNLEKTEHKVFHMNTWM